MSKFIKNVPKKTVRQPKDAENVKSEPAEDIAGRSEGIVETGPQPEKSEK